MSNNRIVPVVTNRPRETRDAQTGTQPRELLYVLQQQNPVPIDRWNSTSKSNTTNPSFDDVQWNENFPNTVQRWDDFTYEAIIAAYGDILASSSGESSRLNSYLQQSDIPETPKEIYLENNVDTLGICWTCNVLRDPLKTAARKLNGRFRDIGDVTLGSKVISWKNPENSRSSFNPDWAIIDRTKTKRYPQEGNVNAKPTLYAVGDSKLYQKWESTYLRHEDPKQAGFASDEVIRIRSQRTKPLEQMATYCRIGETRYGYIVTQKELVVFRARRTSRNGQNPASRPAAFEYKAIPWAEYGPRKLTVNLAIWALGCMGMNPEHRAMEKPNHEPLEGMARLTWWEPANREGTRLRNVISHRELSRVELDKLMVNGFAVTSADGNSHTQAFAQGPAPPRSSRSQGPAPTGQGRTTPDPRNAPPQGSQQSGRPPATTARPGSSGNPVAPSKTFVQVNGQRVEYLTSSKGRYITVSKKEVYIQQSSRDRKYYVTIDSKKPPVEVKFLS